MLDRKNKEKLRKKRKNIINRLQILNEFPLNLEELNDEQKIHYDQIMNFDFTYWEEVKEKNGWGVNSAIPLSQEEVTLRDKRGRVRSYLRANSVLPAYGEPLNEEQQKIIDQIENNDFSFHEKFIQEKLERLKLEAKTSLVQTIIDQVNGESISKQIKLKKNNEESENSKPKMVTHRLRMVEILPKIGEPLSEEHEAIIKDVYENWEGKTKNFFIEKYQHLSTPEGRLYYRLYKSHRDFGYNFNLELSDIVIPEYCPYLNIKLTTDPKDNKEPNYYTGDRIDSSKGYVKGNLQVISLKANIMKNKSTEDQLLKFAVNGLNIIKQFEENVKN